MSLHWSFVEKTFELKRTWSIARGQMNTKTLSFVQLKEGGLVGVGEASCMTGYPYTYQNVRSEFEDLLKTGQLSALRDPVDVQALKVIPPLRFAISSAWTHLQCLSRGITLAKYLDVHLPAQIPISYSIPMVPLEKLTEEVKLAHEFNLIKVKVNHETMVEVVARVCEATKKPIIVDANESWRTVDDFIREAQKLKSYNIKFFEQPFSSDHEEVYEEVYRKSPIPIVLDESIETLKDYERLKKVLSGVNVKLQKSGSYLEARNILKAARRDQKITMLGCSLETSLGIWGACHLAGLADYHDLDGALLLQADPHVNLVKYEGGKLCPRESLSLSFT